MRQVKFRVFKKETEIMYYPEATQEQFNHYLQIGSGGFWLYDKEGKLMCTSNWGDTLMQFTGLKDKNGKDVYEGDIIHSKGGMALYVKWNEKHAAFQYVNDHGFSAIFSGGDSAEVIGNIHQNREHLKG